MKRFVRHTALVLMLLCGLSSCETVVEFSGDYMDPMPVLNSLITPGEPVRVYFSRSVFILDEREPSYVTDGTLELYINDTYVEPLRYTTFQPENGVMEHYYESTAIPQEGDKVTIRARSREFPDWVSANVVVPHSAVLGEMTIREGVSTEERYLTGQIQVPLSDPAGVQNYYWLQAVGVTGSDNLRRTSFFTYSDIAFSEGSSDSIVEELLGTSYDRALFADVMIDGQEEYPLVIDWEFGEWVASQGVTFEVMCYQVDEHLYKYQRSLDLADSASSFGEPVQIYSNVEGGIGIVGARSAQSVVRKAFSKTAKEDSVL